VKETKGRSERKERKRESIEGEGIRVKRRRKIGKKNESKYFLYLFFLRKNFFILLPLGTDLDDWERPEGRRETVKRTKWEKGNGKKDEAATNFVSDFYTMRNSYSEEQFDTKYQEMLAKYEPCRLYLEKRIYPSRESWARYCVSKIFTAGIESTQRVESINGVIKKLVDRGTLF
jgi:hypothetical protein